MKITSGFLDQAILGLEKNNVWIGWNKKFVVVKKDSIFLRVIKHFLENYLHAYSFFQSNMILEKLRRADWTAINPIKKKRFFHLFNKATKGKHKDDIDAYLEAPFLREQEKIEKIFFFVRDYGQIGYVDNFGRIVRLIQKEGNPCLRILINQELVVNLSFRKGKSERGSLSLEKGNFIPYKDVQAILESIYDKSKRCEIEAEIFNNDINNEIILQKSQNIYALDRYFFEILSLMKESQSLSDIKIQKEKEFKCSVRKVGERNLIFEIKWKNRLQADPLIIRDELFALDLSFLTEGINGRNPEVVFSSKYNQRSISEVFNQLEFIIKSIYETLTCVI